ncbi:MAG: efflux RND transporter permease subunit [Phycisphaerae bacterium]|nr:efflux RND transporter permease subunit [Phycisphaerae bacterium]
MEDLLEKKNGLVSWFAQNHVAANILMIVILIGGIFSVFSIKIEVFPDISVDMVTITVPYLGASPAEVEEGVCLRVEEAIAGVDGIKRLKSTAREGMGTIVVELEEYADSRKALDEIKAGVDRIITFPEETEKPIITEITTRNHVITVILHGDVSEKTLKNLANRMQTNLTALKNISQVDVSGVRDFEISIEVSEETLRRYGLSLEQVANAVRQSSLDLPGGSIKTIGGEILFRAKGQMYTGQEFEDIIVMTRPDGTKLRLGEIATVIDAFEDSDIASRYDGQRAVFLKVFRVGEQGALDITDTVKTYLAQHEKNMPEGVSVSIWNDRSKVLKSRIDLLNRNAVLGLILVFICLALFLDLRLAFWTMMGIPISFMGAFCLLPFTDVSINMISLFAFILSLGIVVDDAIVVGENIFTYRQKNMNFVQAAIKGVHEMTAPVTVAVLTTIIAFVPLLNVAGMMGKFIRVIPIIVISILIFSLVESVLILPAHLSGGNHLKAKKPRPGPIALFQGLVRRALDWFINNPFSWLVKKVVAWRYVTLAIGITTLIMMAGFVASGKIKFIMFPKVDADNVVAKLEMPQGTSIEDTQAVVELLEEAALAVQKDIDSSRPEGQPSIFKHILTTLGTTGTSGHAGPRGGDASNGSNVAELNVELLGGEDRGDISSQLIVKKWRAAVGEIPGVSSLTISGTLMRTGEPINVEMSHENFDTLLAAVESLKGKLSEYDGLYDIDDSFDPGKMELKLSLKDQGRTLGLTLSDLARQVRYGFYGAQAQRIQRGRDDVRVMIRYPMEERKSLADIEKMRLRLPNGTEIPFYQVADVQYGRGYSVINRADKRRVVSVTADIDNTVANANEINDNLTKTYMPKLQQHYPGLNFSLEGEQREQKDTMKSLGKNTLIALLAMFGLLAIQFRSYIQPVIVMTAIPFGLVGAVIGHIIMGFDLTLMSLFGIVALAGVVVNDSLIMIDLINRELGLGLSLNEVIHDSATRRFRPIMLTTLTTFFGLMPMLLEKSLQAQFLIPMATSLAFGIVFATGITLLLVPSLYMIIVDIKAAFRWIFVGSNH